ncbi:HEPN domain-containing protein [Pseudomonas protegens]|uniref:HEPN domain-containing protein n=1 Tax=Pseudomonas protegens TaxID=380021 RepID=UPI0011AF199F|nr:HEPN domain-containing protein [Pseudomonas protegens]
MDVYKVEYLSVISSKEIFCKSISSFNNLIQSYDNIKITPGKIKFDNVVFTYEVEFGEIVEETQRYFHVRLGCEDSKHLAVFKSLLRSIRALLTKASDKPPEVLWDDTSSELSALAYPRIHELENMMRKLITKFMLITIGLAWTKDAVPKEVSESIKSKREVGQNYLYEADFIQLSNFLFKEYSTANSRKLVEKLSEAKKIEELSLAELKELVPSSNWERYFSPIVDCKSDYLQPRWERLYALRCIVAHNNLMSSSEYDEICKLSDEVKDKLAQAIKGLDKVQVSSEQKEDVAENIASSMNSVVGEFLFGWNIVYELLFKLAYLSDSEIGKTSITKRERASARVFASGLLKENIIEKELCDEITQLQAIRNLVVHNSAYANGEGELPSFLAKLNSLKSKLGFLIERYTEDPINIPE